MHGRSGLIIPSATSAILLITLTYCSPTTILPHVSHGEFRYLQISSGISQLTFTEIPPQSLFLMLQMHSPFNSLLVSSVQSFDYGASEICEHCGLVSKIPVGTVNFTAYLHSGYKKNVTALFRVDAYGSGYPLPGGCSRHISSRFASSTLSPTISEVPRNMESVSLRYWTSVLRFHATALPGKSSIPNECPYYDNSSLSDRITYYLYGAPLVTAGGMYGAYTNPDVHEVQEVIVSLLSTQKQSGSLLHTFQLEDSSVDGNGVHELPIARRPGLAVVLKLVAEYRDVDEMTRVAYAPVVLYGCPPKPQHKTFLEVPFVVRTHSTQLSCSVLPSNSPNIYFPVAVLLLASLLYGCSCNLLIWLRCAVSVMVMASFVGTLLFFRYSSHTSNAILILSISVVLPGLIALGLFLLLWCLCIRPTLRYQQLFGRGPLLKVNEFDGEASTTTVQQPWNPDLMNANPVNSQTSNLVVPGSDVNIHSINPLSPVTEEHTIHGGMEAFSSTSPIIGAVAIEDDENNVNPITSNCFFGRLFRSKTEVANKKSTKLFSLKPRRLARLPPVLPAAFLVVSCLTILLDQALSLKETRASYLSFVILMGCLIICPLCIFKNLAFGFSTSLVGVYLSLACTCLFLIPNAVLPHILLEQFLRLTWMEHRLRVLRIEMIGLYDVLTIVAWLIGTAIFTLLTLFLVRLHDARELSEAQRGRSYNAALRSQDDGGADAIGYNASLQNEASVWSRSSWCPSHRGNQIGFPLQPETPGPSSLLLSGQEPLDSYGSESLPAASRLFSERSLLLPSSTRVSYGGLASTIHRPLMPLSRVQLAAKSSLAHSSRSPVRPIQPSPISVRQPSRSPQRRYSLDDAKDDYTYSLQH